MKFEIKLTPESQKKINDLADAGKVDLRPVLAVIGVGYRKEVELIFSKQQPRGEDEKWPQLSDSYRAWKEKKFPGVGILVRSGTLKSSMTKQGAQGNISLIGKTSAIFGTSIYYGIFHNEGGAKVPKRNFSEPSDRRANIWIEQIERSIRHNFEVNGIQVSGAILQ